MESLDGLWDFVILPWRGDRAALPGEYPRKILIPSAWETLPGLENYRGPAWLRREFAMPEGGAARLVFGGASHTARVYLDGKPIGGHYDAFTPFDIVTDDLAPGRHEIVVAVDNSFGPESALHIENDYYSYGGLTRPAEIQRLPEVYLESISATPRLAAGAWRLDIRARVRNRSRSRQSREIGASLPALGIAADIGAFDLEPGERGEARWEIEADGAVPWSAESPQLYSLRVALFDDGAIADDMIERIGFREVKTRGKKILLNGRPVRLRGYNRHEDHPQFGCAIPVEAMMADLALMSDLGCNFIRTCHYPNDMRFLDLCDELGFYVWEETHSRTVDFKHPKFREQVAASAREMIEWHGNHPSILMWGCLNECDSVSPAGREEHKRLIELIRALDSTRPVTFASDKAERDICLDLVDIVSWNTYSGWYWGGPPDIAPRLKKYLRWVHSSASGAKGKPVILSEFGAGGIYGVRQRQASKWSEEYQSLVLDECLRTYLNHPDVSGAAVWQFCDCRITQGGDRWAKRPRTMNNKGTVDEYRRPKLAYETVKKRMLEAREKWDGLAASASPPKSKRAKTK